MLDTLLTPGELLEDISTRIQDASTELINALQVLREAQAEGKPVDTAEARKLAQQLRGQAQQVEPILDEVDLQSITGESHVL